MKKGLSSVVTGVLVMLIGMVLVATFAFVFFPFLKKGTEGAPPNECLSVQLAATECIINATTTSLRVARRSGTGNLTGVKFLFNNGSTEHSVERTIDSLDEFESRIFIFLTNEITSPRSVDLAPILDPHRICAPYHAPVVCSSAAGDVQTSQACQFITVDWLKEGLPAPSIVGLGDNLTLTLNALSCAGSNAQFSIEKRQGVVWTPISPPSLGSLNGDTYSFVWNANTLGEYRFIVTSLMNNSITLTSRSITVAILTSLACSNGVDDDNDGRIDSSDRGCLDSNTMYNPSDTSENDPGLCGYLWNVVGSSANQIPVQDYPSIQSSGLFKVGLLNQGYFGTYPYYIGNTEYNGGIPQRVNITRHLQIAEQHLNSEYPDPNWTGYMVIDYESWHPLWEWNYVWQNWKYINESIDYYRANHNTAGMTYPQIEAAAGVEFNDAARAIWEQTIEMGKRVRPRAVWGYYGYPVVTTINAATPVCPRLQGEPGLGMNACRRGLNDMLNWLTNASDAVYPELYQQYFVNESMPANIWWPWQSHINENVQRVDTILDESQRVTTNVGGRIVAPYISLTFISSDANPYNSQLIYNSYNFNDSYFRPLQTGKADGLIIWNSVTPTANPNAAQYSEYLQTIAGPQTELGVQRYC